MFEKQVRVVVAHLEVRIQTHRGWKAVELLLDTLEPRLLRNALHYFEHPGQFTFDEPTPNSTTHAKASNYSRDEFEVH